MSLSTNQDNVCEGCEFDKNLELLRDIPLFSALPLESQRAYAYLCRRIRYQTNDTLFRQEEVDDKAYIIISGTLHLYRKTAADPESTVPCGSIEAGQFFGAMALVADVRRLFTARAATPTVCLVMPRKKILTDLIQKPEIAAQFLKGLTNRVIAWEEKHLQKQQEGDSSATELSISLI